MNIIKRLILENYILIIFIFCLNCASYKTFSNLSANHYFGCEFDYYDKRVKILKGYYVPDSIEGGKKRVLQVNRVLSKREKKTLLFYIPRQPKKEKFIDNCEDLFNNEYLNYDSILPSFNIKDLIDYHKKINEIKVKEEKFRKEIKDSIVAVVIPHYSYPYKEKILRSLIRFKNYPIFLIDDYKKNRCFILFPVLGSDKRISYYLGKINNAKLDYVVRSKKKLIIFYTLVPFALAFDMITSPIQLYLLINFPDMFISKVKGF